VPIINLTLTKRDLEKLRPCPFCGSTRLEINNTHRAYYWIMCLGCDASGILVEVGGSSFGRDVASEDLTRRHHQMAKQGTMDAWNRRPDVASPPKRR